MQRDLTCKFRRKKLYANEKRNKRKYSLCMKLNFILSILLNIHFNNIYFYSLIKANINKKVYIMVVQTPSKINKPARNNRILRNKTDCIYKKTYFVDIIPNECTYFLSFISFSEYVLDYIERYNAFSRCFT